MPKRIMEAPDKTKQGSSYYVTLFTVEGHKRWRMHTSPYPDGFELQCKDPLFPKVIDVQRFRIDRYTGKIMKLVV